MNLPNLSRIFEIKLQYLNFNVVPFLKLHLKFIWPFYLAKYLAIAQFNCLITAVTKVIYVKILLSSLYVYFLQFKDIIK